jgi:succinate dehydrogenase / fumarate reductase cytochrome b subunit
MKPKRPVFLDLWRIKLPAMGLVSILHRVSGVLLVLAIPLFAHLFHQSLAGPEGFASAAATLTAWPMRLVLLVLGWSLLHHLFAGIRYLALDLGVGLEREAARATARTAIAAALVVLVIGGGALL